ncbi:MAG: hypothetical protein JWO31_1652 [Phycisphaerales bacterium]|nr:hypothetical protein [Phycisphaerales bacterium]
MSLPRFTDDTYDADATGTSRASRDGAMVATCGETDRSSQVSATAVELDGHASMRSIRRSLCVGLVSAVVLLGAVAAALCYARASALLAADFDRGLLAQATALGASVHREPEGTLAVTEAAKAPGRRLGRFQIRDAAGRTLLRSEPLDEPDPAVPDSPNPVQFWTVTSPGRPPVRLVRVRFLPGVETEQEAVPATGPSAPIATTIPVVATAAAGVPQVTLVLAEDLGPVRRMERLLIGSLGLALAGLCGGVLVVVPLVVRRGLASVDRLAEQAERIEASSLGTRFETAGVPDELRPICGRLNDLLARLEDAFRRERRFTANVAHELRTPVAELRTMAEVALRWPGDAAATNAVLREVLAVSLRMESVVAALLSLARSEAGTVRPPLVAVDLTDVVDAAWRAAAPRAAERCVRATFDLPTSAVVSTDPTLLRTIVGNLLANAVEYCPAGGVVACGARRPPDGSAELTVSNPAGGLTAAELPLVAEAFWRREASGTDSDHAGLGLSLVAAYAKVLGATFDVALTPNDHFTARFRLPPPAGLPAAAAEVPGRGEPTAVAGTAPAD